jgi:hypothetical protein
MTATEKEGLFVLLRKYHQAPEFAYGPEVTGLAKEIDETKDKIVSMMLGLLRGKAVFKNWTPELNALSSELQKQYASEQHTEGRTILADKIKQLYAIITLAHADS